MKHAWKVYLTASPQEPLEREVACDCCGVILTDENEDADDCGEESNAMDHDKPLPENEFTLENLQLWVRETYRDAVACQWSGGGSYISSGGKSLNSEGSPLSEYEAWYEVYSKIMQVNDANTMNNSPLSVDEFANLPPHPQVACYDGNCDVYRKHEVDDYISAAKAKIAGQALAIKTAYDLLQPSGASNPEGAREVLGQALEGSKG